MPDKRDAIRSFIVGLLGLLRCSALHKDALTVKIIAAQFFFFFSTQFYTKKTQGGAKICSKNALRKRFRHFLRYSVYPGEQERHDPSKLLNLINFDRLDGQDFLRFFEFSLAQSRAEGFSSNSSLSIQNKQFSIFASLSMTNSSTSFKIID